jgi:DUF1009 family protein
MNDKYAFIIGKGDLPEIIIQYANNNNFNFIIAGIKGLSPKLLVNKYNHFWFNIGEVSDLIAKLKQNNINKIVMIGSITRPSLLSLRVDNLGKSIISNYYNKISGDNSLLSMVMSVFESYGFEVVSPQSVCAEILAQEKNYTSISYQPYINDIKNGFILAQELSKLDIGQSIIYQENIVIAVEAVEGTKNMILRSKKLLKKSSQGILIKIHKLNQDNRVDLPSIGEQTIIQAKKAKLAGIVIQADKTIILNQKKTIQLANKYNIFLLAVNNISKI